MCDGGLLGRSEDKIGEVDFHFLRCWGKICLVFAVLLLAGLPISRSPVSTSHHIVGVLESQTYIIGFPFSHGFKFRWSSYCFYLQSHPPSSVICFDLFACNGYFSFPVALFLSRKRSDFSFRMKKGELIDGEMRKYLQMEVRIWVLIPEELWVWRLSLTFWGW